VVAFVALQVALLLWASFDPSVRDPEYGRREAAVRGRTREHPGRPLVLLLGSSRVTVNVDTDALAARHPDGPLVFNFGINGSGPERELVTLHRAFAAGLRPACVVVETHFDVYRRPPPDATKYARDGWADVGVLTRYSDRPDELERYRVTSHLAPWYFHRQSLQLGCSPDLVPKPNRDAANDWQTITPWGYLPMPLLDVGDEERPNNLLRVANTRPDMLARSERGQMTDRSAAAFREMKGLCDSRGCRVVLFHAPDLYTADYADPARARIDAELAGLSESLGAPLLDFRQWGREEDFFDGVHLTREAARRFTADLEPHLLRAVSDPAGRTGAVWQAPPVVRWGDGFSAEEATDSPGWRRFRWCAADGTLTLTNLSPTPRRVVLSFSPQSYAPGPCNLAIEGPGLSEVIGITAGPKDVRRSLLLPSGSHAIRFRCDGTPLVHPARTIVFALHEFELTVEGK